MPPVARRSRSDDLECISKCRLTSWAASSESADTTGKMSLPSADVGLLGDNKTCAAVTTSPPSLEGVTDKISKQGRRVIK